MKAIRIHEFGDPNALSHLEDLPRHAPGAGQVLVHLFAAGINPVDGYILSGTYATRPALPYTPGFDGSGIIEAVGEGVSPHLVGTKVYLIDTSHTGTYAEYVTCDASHVAPLPEHLSFSQGAALWVAYATAYRAMFQLGQASSCKHVLVHGASGSVGTACLQWARWRGIPVVGTASSEAGRALILEQGAEAALPHGGEDDGEALLAQTEGRGYDLIVEMAAHRNANLDLKLLARRGTLMVIGNRGPTELDLRRLMQRDARIMATTLFALTQPERQEIVEAIAAASKLGVLSPVIHAVLPLSQAAEAHRRLHEEQAHGKWVLDPTAS